MKPNDGGSRYGERGDAAEKASRSKAAPLVRFVDALPHLPPGNSIEQQEAESIMVAALSMRLKVELAPRSVELPEGGHLEIDAADAEGTIFVEALAHQPFDMDMGH